MLIKKHVGSIVTRPVSIPPICRNYTKCTFLAFIEANSLISEVQSNVATVHMLFWSSQNDHCLISSLKRTWPTGWIQ